MAGKGKIENLKPLNGRSKDEREAIQAKGRAAFKAKREQELLVKQTLLTLLALPSDVVFGENVLDDKGCPANALYAGCLATLRRWRETGDAGALEKIMTAIGQKPAEKSESKVQAQVVYGWED